MRVETRGVEGDGVRDAVGEMDREVKGTAVDGRGGGGWVGACGGEEARGDMIRTAMR